MVEQPQLLAQQEGAVEPAVLALDLGQRRELVDALVGRGLEQAPAGALDPTALGRVRAVVAVPFVAADLVGRACAKPDDVERVKADLRVGDARIARWYSPDMSIKTARIDSRRSPSSSKKPCRVALLRPGAHHTIAPVLWSATVVR